MPIEKTADELTEIATIFAAGLLRLRNRKSSPNLPANGESSLDCEGNPGGDVANDFGVLGP
jgi:hypothetical protein